jgi:hypothetical protein
MNDEIKNQDGIVCPACNAQLVGVTPCPDPEAHEHREPGETSTPSFPLCGGQQPPYRSWYETDARGRAMITFRAHDGTEREYPVLWGYVDPDTGIKYPYMIDQGTLDLGDLLHISGKGKRALEAISAHLPGRTGSYTVQCETTQFITEWLFWDLTNTASKGWRRPARREKKLRHRPECPPHCRKSHRGGN